MTRLAWLGLLAACNGSNTAVVERAPGPVADAAPLAPVFDASADPPSVAAAVSEACANACTMYAYCWEVVNESDFRKGTRCVMDCEARSPGEREAFLAEMRALERIDNRKRWRLACRKYMGE